MQTNQRRNLCSRLAAWNRCKAARPVTDDEFTIYDLRFTIGACTAERRGELFSIGNRQSASQLSRNHCSSVVPRMKPNPPTPVPPALTGRRYWRSLDELADTPEFKEWLQREFPQGASEFERPRIRRHFVKIMSASFALAGLGVMGAGCRRPEEKLEPFGQQPDGLCLWRAAIFCHGHADAHRRDSAGRQILRRPAHQDRGQRAYSPAATAAPTATRRLRFSTFTIPTARSGSRTTAKPFRATKR